MGRPVRLVSGQVTVAVAGERVQLPANCCLSVTIKAKSDNTGNIYLGGSNVSSSNGFILGAGEAISIDIDNANDIWVDAGSNGDGVSLVIIS